MIEVEIEHFTDFAAIINRINTVGNSIVQALGTDELIKQIIGDGGTIVDGIAALLKTEAAPIMFAAEALRSETEFVAAFKRGDYLGAAASASVFVTRFTDSALCGYASAQIAATPFAAVAKEVGFLCDQALSKMFDFNITNSIELGSLIGDVTAQEDTKRFNIQLARYIRSRTDFKYSKGSVPRCGAWFMDPDKNSCDLSDLACVPITSTYPCRLGGIRGVVPYDPGKVETAGEAIILQAQQAEENATLLKAAIDRAVAQLIEDLKRERPPVPVIDVRPGTTGTAPFIVFFDGTNSKQRGVGLIRAHGSNPVRHSVLLGFWRFQQG